MPKSNAADYIVIGAGILGAAVVHQLLSRKPGSRVVVIEKADGAASHQTGRNSGVVHAGVYYPPNSLKARFCKEGLSRTLSFCKRFNLPHEQCGKIIVATDEKEDSRLEALFQRCQQNGLNPIWMGYRELSQDEPYISGVRGVRVDQTAITDYQKITACLLDEAATKGKVLLQYNTRVEKIEEYQGKVKVVAKNTNRPITFEADSLVCCAGVYADEMVTKQGLIPDFKILPFRGEYFRLSPKFNKISQRLIYPVPDPAMPFLGVHLTKMIGGYTTVGPNAVLASGREAYDSVCLKPQEWWRSVTFPGLWKLLWRYRASVIEELKTSVSRQYYAKQVARYCPTVSANDFLPYRAGIRAQAVSDSGDLIQDFRFHSTPQTLHVTNAPSPAATSALPIADAIVEKLLTGKELF